MKHCNYFKCLVILVATLLPQGVMAYDFKVDGLCYNITGDGTVAVTYEQSSTPRYINLSGTLSIPSTVTYGGTTYSVTSIGSSAFYGCRGLTSVTIPNSVKSIGDNAFRNCSGLTSVAIPNSVTSIGINAFYYCSGLTSVTIPNSVTTIGGSAFADCTGLRSVTIPNSVTSIGNNAFAGCRDLESISVESGNMTYDSRNNCNAIIETATNTLIVGCKNTIIPNSVTSIGYSAFLGCTGLTSVTIPNSVTSIGDYTFDGCSGLTSVTIGNSVMTIGDWAFAECDRLTSVPIPNSVTSIGERAFWGCTSLTSVTIPNSVTTIGDWAFAECDRLTSVTIPDSVTSIGKGAFLGTAWYENQPDGLIYAGLVAYKYKGTMPSGTSITLKDGTKGIAGEAFVNCSGLTSMTISNSVTTIGEFVFYGCSGLTDIYSEIENPSNVSTHTQVFNNVPTSTCVLHVPAGTADLYRATSPWSSFTNIVEMPEQHIVFADAKVEEYCLFWDSNQDGVLSFAEAAAVTSLEDVFNESITMDDITSFDELQYFTGINSIPRGAFWGSSRLTSVIIPNSVTTIGYSAFRDCTGLTSVTIPNSVTSIGDNAFRNCSGLTSVAIPNSVTTIGNYAFQYCTGLTNVAIGNSVTTIGEAAFLGCSGLTSVAIPNSVETIDDGAFLNCSGLESVTIPNSVTTIGKAAFSGCSGWESISVESGNTKYDSRDNCNAIIETATNTLIVGCKNTIIPNSVTTIGNWAFENCSGLTSVTIPNSVTSIGNQAFKGCTGLSSVTIPNSVTTIGNYAFSCCSGLTSVTIPNSVTSIGSGAFSGCSGLESISVESGNTKYDSRNNCNAIIETTTNTLIVGCKNTIIPNSVTTIGGSAFSGCSGLMSVTIPNSVTTIGNDAFNGCTGLTSVTIPNSVTTIGNFAFANCSGLTSVTIPNSVTTIGDYAFSECTGLTDIYSEIENPYYVSTRTNAFNSVPTSTCVLHVPAGTADLYRATSPWSSFTNIVEMEPSVIPATSIAMSQNTAALAVGETVTLAATVLPDDATDKSVVWSTSNEEVATVEAGVVTAVAAGTATITATTADGSDLSATCEVTVTGTDQPVLADNRIEVADCSAHSGDSFVLDLNMVNTDDAITAFQVDMYLPEGLTLVLDEYDDPLVDLEATRLRNRDDHTVMVAEQPDGAIRIMSYSPTTKPFIGNEGALVHVTLKVQEELEDCELSVVFRDVTLTNVDEQEYITDALTCHVSVSRYQRGDVNGDDKVNVTDIVALANRVMGSPSQNFIERMADVSGDGKVNVTDIVALSKLVMGEGTSNGAPARVPARNDAEPYAVLHMADFSIEAGGTKEVAIQLESNVDNITAFELYMDLPEGLSIALDEDEYDVWMAPDLLPRRDDHTVMASLWSDGSIKLMTYSGTTKAFKTGEGDVIYMTLRADESFAGDHQLTIKNVTITDVDEHEYLPEDFTCTVTGPAIEESVTLAEVLEGTDGENYRLSEDLTVVTLVGNHAYATAADNWVRLDVSDAEGLQAGSVLSNVKGTLSGAGQSPALAVETFEAQSDVVDVTGLVQQIDLSSSFEMPAPAQVVEFLGYYFDGKLRGWSNNSGQSLELATDYAAPAFEQGKRYKVLVGIELIEPWRQPAPRRIAAQGYDYDFQNLRGQVVNASEVVITDIDTLRMSEQENTYRFNVLGQPVDEDYRGIVIENGTKRLKR